MDSRCFAKIFWVFLLALFLPVTVSFAETTCDKNGCDIIITLKMAFSGANDTYINNAKNEIENFWNGPNGFRLVGDCWCKITVKVETKKITDPAQVNCNPGPPGYHCIMVTDYATNPPRNQTNIAGARLYRGYMYGIATGNGNNNQRGWWSNAMSQPQGGTNYMDMAHEAGHMMGLDHNNDTTSIMNNTANTQPNQADLEGAARNICGDGYCPDRCCCGNGMVDKKQGENCDPAASPTGCAAGASCCPVCCQCYKPLCIAANGEYLTLNDCQRVCGPDSACYKNYKTGCWDCLKQTVVITGTCRDHTVIRGNITCDHVVPSFAVQSTDFYKNSLTYAPIVGSIFANERINLKTAEGDAGYLVTKNGNVTEFGTRLLSDPTVTLSTDRETIRLIAGGRMSVQQALSGGKIEIEGNDFFSGFKFGVYKFMFDIYNFFNPTEEAISETEGPEFPQEYFDAMGRLRETSPETKPGVGRGEPPDTSYSREMRQPS